MASAQVTPQAKRRRPPPRAMPPRGVDDAEGEWASETYCGWCTACVYLVCWPVACCPVDRRRIYVTSRGVRHYRDGRKVPRWDGLPEIAAMMAGMLSTLVLCWAYVHKCSNFEICTDWCKTSAMFSIANDPSNGGASFIHRWGDDVVLLKQAIRRDGLFETLGAAIPARGDAVPELPALDLESVDVKRLVDTESNVDVFVVDALFQTPWGPPDQWFRELSAAGWSVYATFSGELDLDTCKEQRRSYLSTNPPANSTVARGTAVQPSSEEPAGLSMLELQALPAARSWKLQCDGERVQTWYEDATQRATLGSPAPTLGKWPSYSRGLCVFGSFMDGELQCTGTR